MPTDAKRSLHQRTGIEMKKSGTPYQDSEVRALDLGRRLPRQQHVPERRAGDDRAGGLEEAATVEGGGGGLGRALLTHRGTSSRRDENGSRGTACTPWPWIEW